jgi:D-alanyl-D-alanine carboxypeptidase
MRLIALWFIINVVCVAGMGRGAWADGELPAEMTKAIDKAVIEAIGDSGAPSASIAVVKDGKIAYRHAFGVATIKPAAPAAAVMRYRIGSIGKQFVAAAVLMLAEEQKLSLDDKVERWVPSVTRAGEVTVRQLLSMTAGYQDYWPQDYMPPAMLAPASSEQILKWAQKPLDFDPGTKWQYSNTDYVIAGLIVEKVSGVPLAEFLQKRIFKPLEMTTAGDVNHGAATALDATGYLRYGIGPLRAAPMEGAGWLFATGDLTMTAGDLALWDISMIDQKLLKPESYRAMQTEVQLPSGASVGYGLGVGVRIADDHRQIWHNGVVSGYSAQNYVYPDEHAAIVVLTNLDASGVAELIATRIASIILPESDPGADAAILQMRQVLENLQRGTINRKLFTDNANAYFSEQALKDFASSLGPLGAAKDIVQAPRAQRNGMVLRRFRARFGEKFLDIATFTMPDGKLEQFLVIPAE